MTFQRLAELVLAAAALCRADLALPPSDEATPTARPPKPSHQQPKQPCRSTRSYGPRATFR
jgi:hypothetical protein